MLHVHRADRADGLADALATLCAQPLPDPFAAEVVAVPTRGMERWLTQRMSAVLGASPQRADGICAGVEFPTPHRLVSDAIAAASGVDPAEDPWLPERATWPLLEVVERSLEEPWLATLAAYLGCSAGAPDPVRHARRLSVVRHLARLYGLYAMHRPVMLAAWAQGHDVDVVGAPLAAGSGWQAELWRRLRARIALPGPAERRAGACERLAVERDLVVLPERFSLFGLTRLPAGHLEVLRALAKQRDVHLFLLHPSGVLWETVADALAAAGRPPWPGSGAPPTGGAIVRRADDPTASLAANPLLASWGRDSRELQVVLGADVLSVDDTGPRPAPKAPTLLRRSQDDIRADREPRGEPLPGKADGRPLLAADDRSVEIHACHGRARQVEVIRDAILHALAEDESLEPRDVIVMCPDIETFAPLIQATFGAGETSDDGSDEAVSGVATQAVSGVAAQAVSAGGDSRSSRPPRRPLAAPDQPGARRHLGAARARPAAADRLPGS